MRVVLPLLAWLPAVIAKQPEGIDYLGAGYDVVFGNPDGSEASSSVTDPGFRVHLIKYNWDKDGNTCSGLSNDWTCPREVSIMPDTSCMQQSSSTAITSTKEFQEALKDDCSFSKSVSGKYYLVEAAASFSGSKAMASMEKKISKDQVTTFQSKAICVEYTATLKLGLGAGALQPLPEFITALDALPPLYKSCYLKNPVAQCQPPETSAYGDLPTEQSSSRRLAEAGENPILASGLKFTLRSVAKPTLCVDDSGVMGSSFHLWECSADNVNQVFSYDAATSMIRSGTKAGMCVDSSNSFTLYSCDTNNANQKFVYNITSQAFRKLQTTKCMDDGGGTTSGQTNMALRDCGETNNNQHFAIEPWFQVASTDAPTPVIQSDTVDCACDASVVAYFRFIQMFGTHYTTRVEMGGKIVHRLEIKNSDVETLQEKKVDIAYGTSIKASYGSKLVNVSAAVTFDSANSNSDATKSYNSVMAVAKKEININVGGSPSDDWHEWAKSTSKTPMPIRYRLSSLVDLIQTANATKVEAFKTAVQDYITAYGKTLPSNASPNAKVVMLEIKYSLKTPAMGWIQFRVMIGGPGAMIPAVVTMYTTTGSFTIAVPLKYQVRFASFNGKVSVTLQYLRGRLYPDAHGVSMEAEKPQHHASKAEQWIAMEAEAEPNWSKTPFKFGVTTPQSVTLNTVEVLAILSDGTEQSLGDPYAGAQLQRETDWPMNPMPV